MIIEYTGRQTSITKKYKDQVEAGLSRIEKLVSGAASAKVVLTTEKYRRIADVSVIQGDKSIVAACEAPEMMTALRDALAKIESQAVKQSKRASTIARHPKNGMALPEQESAAS